MHNRTSKLPALAGVVAFALALCAPAFAQQEQPAQTTTQILNQCNSGTLDMAQAKACLQTIGKFLWSALPGQQANVLLDVMGDRINSIVNDPPDNAIDPDVSTPPAPGDPSDNDPSQ